MLLCHLYLQKVLKDLEVLRGQAVQQDLVVPGPLENRQNHEVQGPQEVLGFPYHLLFQVVQEDHWIQVIHQDLGHPGYQKVLQVQ